MLSIEGKELPEGVTNPYWDWNKEHSVKEDCHGQFFQSKKKRKENKSQFIYKQHKDTKAWWRSLTAVEQADYRYKKMCDSGKYDPESETANGDWNREYSGVLKLNQYKH